MMMTLAEKLELRGCAQADLILDKDGSWNIIEINPRLSGMSFTYACWLGVSLFEMMYRVGCAFLSSGDLKSAVVSTGSTTVNTVELKYVLNLKLPLLSKSQMTEILQLPGIRLLNQTNDLAAKQEREKGFCECIIVDEDKSVLENTVARLCELFSEDSIVQQSALMLKQWNR